MMRAITLLIITVLMSLQLIAQDDHCTTPDITEEEFMNLPWYGNDDYLDLVYDSMLNEYGNPFPITARGGNNDIENTWFRVPVKFWVYQEAPGIRGGDTPFPTEVDFQRSIDEANITFRTNGIPIRLYMRCPEFINAPEHIVVQNITVDGLSDITLRLERQTMNNANRDNDAINVHIVERGGNNWWGIAAPIIVMDRARLRDLDIGHETFVHEIGHALGLLHTQIFRGFPCRKELVSRSVFRRCGVPLRWCNISGDGFCDTPADPGMDEADITRDCEYIGGERDSRGDFFVPDTRNVMAGGNGRNNCRSRFSDSQGKAMLNKARRRGYPATRTLANGFDRFEPDNIDLTAREIMVGETRNYSMHNSDCVDEEDWLRFTVPLNQGTGGYELTLSAAGSSPYPVTSVELFTSTQVGFIFEATAPFNVDRTNFINNQGKIFISCHDLTPGDTYLIRISNENGGGLGCYDLSFNAFYSNIITSAPQVCYDPIGTTFSLPDVRPGSTVTWSIAGSNLGFVGSNVGQSVNVRSIDQSFTGTACVTATITHPLPLCEGSATICVQVGSPRPNFVSGNSMKTVCKVTESTLGTDYYERVEEIEGNPILEYEWQNITNNFGWIVQGNEVFLNTHTEGIISFRVRTRNTCGWSPWRVKQYTVNDCSVGEGGGGRGGLGFGRIAVIEEDKEPKATIYPNPSAGLVNINISNGEQTAQQSTHIVVYDLLGKVVMTKQTDQQETTLDLSGNPKGVYVIHITQKDFNKVSRVVLK